MLLSEWSEKMAGTSYCTREEVSQAFAQAMYPVEYSRLIEVGAARWSM